MKETKTAAIKKAVLWGSICLLALTGLFALAACGSLSGMYARSPYTVDDFLVERESVRVEQLQGYKNYAGKVIKLSPLHSGNWLDYSRVFYKDLNIAEPGQYQIIVSMSAMLEKTNSPKSQTAAYRPSERYLSVPTKIRWKGPGNVGLTVSNGEDFYAPLDKPLDAPEGEWTDFSFSQAFDFQNAANLQVYLDGHNDQQGLVDSTIYIRHLKVEAVKVDKAIALTFDEGPTDFTNFLVDKLDEHGVKGTFFVLGAGIDARLATDRNLSEAERIEKSTERQATVKRIFSEGHELANLSYSNNYFGAGRLDGSDGIDSGLGRAAVVPLAGYTVTDYPLNEAAIRKEIEDTQIAIQKAVYGEQDYTAQPWVSKYFRAPFDIDLERAGTLRSVARELGLPIVGGFRFETDADGNAVNEIIPWGIYQSKDPRIEPATLKLLDSIIPKLKAEGYIFLTLGQLVERRKTRLGAGEIYRHFNLDLQ